MKIDLNTTVTRAVKEDNPNILIEELGMTAEEICSKLKNDGCRITNIKKGMCNNLLCDKDNCPFNPFNNHISFEQCKEWIMKASKPKTLSGDELLAEAKKRYPIGTVYRCASYDTFEYTVKEQRFTKMYETVIQGELGKGCLYHNGKWAEIISLPEVKPQYQKGDWVTVVPSDNNFPRYSEAIGYTFQIRKDGDSYDNFIKGEETAIDPINKYYINYRLQDVRPATPEEIAKATSNKVEEYPEYYEFIKETKAYSFTKGRIYKIINPANLIDCNNFIDDKGKPNGYGPNNSEYFKPSTKEAYDAQNAVKSIYEINRDGYYIVNSKEQYEKLLDWLESRGEKVDKGYTWYDEWKYVYYNVVRNDWDLIDIIPNKTLLQLPPHLEQPTSVIVDHAKSNPVVSKEVMKPTKFEVGKWYKYNNWYIKYENHYNNIWTASEKIDSKRKYSKEKGAFGYSESDNLKVLLTDLSEIQQYLPDGHPDKISLSEFPVEGHCKIIDNRLIEFLEERLPLIKKDKLKTNSTIIAWNNSSYWFCVTSCNKKEYNIKELEKFFNTSSNKNESVKYPEITEYAGLKIGDVLPAKVISAWEGVGENSQQYGENSGNWKKFTSYFKGNRTILSFKEINGIVGFLVSDTCDIYLRADGFKEFMDNFESKPIIKENVELIQLEEQPALFSLGINKKPSNVEFVGINNKIILF